MTTVTIPDIIYRKAGIKERRFDVVASTVREALEKVVEAHPELGKYIFDQNGQIPPHFLLVRDEHLVAPEASVDTSSQLELMIATSGGNASKAKLSKEEISRYARHITLPVVSKRGQECLKEGRVLVVGAGGLGSPALLYLAAAGVGTIGIVDFDSVEESNLQRQIIHDEPSVGMSKVESAQRKVKSLNRFIKVQVHKEELSIENGEQILSDYDVVIDGSDNFATRYLINDLGVVLGKPVIFGSVFQFEGRLSVFNVEGGGPCYRCLFPEEPPSSLAPSCSAGGVVGILPGLVGVLQASEAIKIIAGIGEPVVGKLLKIDALSTEFKQISFQSDPDCLICSDANTTNFLSLHTRPSQETNLASPNGQSINQIHPKELLASIFPKRPPHLNLLDVREPGELEICKIEGSINIPLDQLEDRIGELNENQTHIVICYSGTRAFKAASILKNSKLEDITVLSGGIKKWIIDVDSSMPLY